MPDGFLLIDKPSGPTSHDVVDEVRRILLHTSTPSTSPSKEREKIRPPKVGHAGTLDPFATGLLIIGIGRATKKLGGLVGLDKEYEATLRLGAVSDTLDRTGAIERLSDRAIEFTSEQIKRVLNQFTGTIQQIPPMYSAKKVGGKKLYELARKGIEIERKPITVTIYSIEIIHNPLFPPYPKGDVGLRGGELVLRVRCSSGTYIRALAHDIGQALGCGAYLEELRRTAIGKFRVDEAVPLADLTAQNICDKLIPETVIYSSRDG